MKDNIAGHRKFPYDTGYSGPVGNSRYFEGWYHRHVSADSSLSLAVIVGVALDPDPHAFIQLMAGPEHRVLKIRYPLESFHACRDRHEVTLEGNTFSPEGMVLDIDRDGIRIYGSVRYTGQVEYPVNFFSPGIMGPFSWVPFMECIHGVVSMDHSVDGTITWDDKLFKFDTGRGYIEKDRGQSMPREWIWLHANLFEKPGDSLMLSVAHIPWLGSSFIGHLGFLLHGGELWKIGTYAGTKVSGSVDGDELFLKIRGRGKSLELRIESRGHGGGLDAPVRGSMNREIVESSDAIVTAVLGERGQLLWEGQAGAMALERAGDSSVLLR